METFSTIYRTETWHLILIIAINKGWPIIQYNVKNAFIHADINANIYTILPIRIYNKDNTRVCYLNKALYGLKQSPRLWYKHLSKILNIYNFIVFLYNKGIYLNKIDKAILISYIDDILIICPNINYINQFYSKIKQYIKLEEIGQVSTFLGNNININYQDKTISINQSNYTKKLLTKFNIYNNIYYKPI